MRNGPLFLLTSILVAGCGNVRLQTPEELGQVLVDSTQRQQSKRLCEQQKDPAMRMRCEQQVNNEFQKYQHEQRKNKDE
jgi:hypothetical protein